MERHEQIVAGVAEQIQQFHQLSQPYRIFHGSSNSTRPRHDPRRQNIIDVSALSHVLSVNTETLTALVEPNVPMDRLVEATLPHGVVPPVVMEFPGITAGGGFSGSSAESSSFRHGFFNDNINFVEMVLPSGEVVRASPSERADLFHGAAGALGTLGTVTLMELRLVKASSFVKTTYHRTESIDESIKLIESKTTDFGYDYLDGILFSRDHGVIVSGEMVDDIPPGHEPRTFSGAGDPWFYMHVEEITKNLPESASTLIEYVPLGEYLFRYDRAGFWVGRQGYTYFKCVPFNRFFRWLLDDFSHTRTLYHALHASGVSSQFVVQDLGLPYSTAGKFIDFVEDKLAIWPLWLCPLRAAQTPTFHPVTAHDSTEKSNASLLDEKAVSSSTGNSLSSPMLNIGVWGWGPSECDAFLRANRELEDELVRLGGRKWLYAHTYYSEAEFWRVYDRPWYESLRQKYKATSLPSVYDKVKIDVDAKRKKMESETWVAGITSRWPVGGLWGMWLAWRSGDIGCHREAQWKFKQS